ncbi:MAG: CehA/McbA family metallohydrolase [Gemmataceae bacterium]
MPACDFISTMDTDRVAEFNMWYHLLNCGSRIRASGETDFPCISGERVGMGRIYVKLHGPVDFDTWVQGLADGKSYVSDGTTHLMDPKLTVGETTLVLGEKGSELNLDKPQRAKVTFKAAAYQTGKTSVPVELVVNGYPVAKKDLVCDGKTREITLEADITKSSWIAVRVFPHAHTNPFFVLVNEKPIRANADSARWCQMGVEQCWMMKNPTYKKAELAQAEADYDHARKHYQKVLEETAK